jgi:superoxide dismutase, Fe-Mn family
MKFELMSLPYSETALEPHISSETVSYHYGKHHAGYVKKLNGLIENSDFEDKSLEYIIKNAEGGVFNNAAQVYNHDFYWNCLSPDSSTPSVELSDMIERDFESLDNFKTQFLDAAATLFGSGWVWLVMSKEGKLLIRQYSNAQTPLQNEEMPLLTCDVWEHAYYLDYQNLRPDYLQGWWQLINWNFVSENFANIE